MLEFLVGIVFNLAMSGQSAQACLALNIWHEARGEGVAGMALVAQNVIARVESPYYADTVCGVVFETMPGGGAAAYSWTTDAIPDRPVIRNAIDLRAFENAMLVAQSFLDENEPVRFAGLEQGVLYHSSAICPPFCKSPLTRAIAQVGSHVIYSENRSP